MIRARLGAILLLVALANAQRASAPKSTPSAYSEPELPVIDHNACPFEGCVFREWVVRKRSTIYNTWREERKVIGELAVGEKVQGITGTYITWKPDRFLVKKPIRYFSLQPGDVILQYQEWGEGYSDLWAKGGWHRDFDWGATEEGDAVLTQDGFTLPPVFPEGSFTLIEPGVKEWWVEVKRKDGSSGWVLAKENFGNMDRLGGSGEKTDGTAKAGDVPEPKLPVIDEKACPGAGRIVPGWRLDRSDRIYSSFRSGREIGTLKAGEKLTVLAGVDVIREPDRGVIRQPIPDTPLVRGDTVFRYGYHSDGDFEFWGKGVTFSDSYEGIVEKGGDCSFRDYTNCDIAIVKNGVNEWWVQVKSASGVTGWVLAYKRAGDEQWNDGNFGTLCNMD